MNDSHIDPLPRSARLKEEANFILQAVSLYEIMQPYGRITPTGSYYLDVMIYLDIDLYLSPVSIEALFAMGGQLAASDLVARRFVPETANQIRGMGTAVED
jgi:hypothetical protein